jgi:hypothetical protein
MLLPMEPIDLDSMTIGELKALHSSILEKFASFKSLAGPHPYRTRYSDAAKLWDWSKSNTVISRENRVCVGTVAKYREKLNMPQPPRDYEHLPPKQHGLRKFHFDSVNWETPDIEIARSLGCTRELVRQTRAKLGIPKHLFHHVKYQRFLEHVGDRKELHHSDCPKGINHITFRTYCNRAGILIIRQNKRIKHPWHLMNWSLPNNVLEDIWGFGNNNGIATHRCNHGLPKPEFYSLSLNIPDPFKEAVSLERQKAEEWRKSQP